MVDDTGLVMGAAAGEATITATSLFDPEVSGAAVVTVTPAPTVTGVLITPRSLSMGCNDTRQLTATVEGENDPPQDVTWTSSNESVATVDATGLVTTRHRGFSTDVTITATSTFAPSVAGSARVTVGGVFGCI